MLGGLTIYPPGQPVANFLQCICAKSNENWLSVQTSLFNNNNHDNNEELTFWGQPEYTSIYVSIQF